MQPKLTILFVILAVIVVGLSQAIFVVDERQQAIMLFLGKPDGDINDRDSLIKKPGLHFKIPFLHTVRYFDRRILSLDPPPAQVVIASASLNIDSAKPEDDSVSVIEIDPFENVTGEPIIVDTFARYKIVDPLRFLNTLQTITQANNRLESILNDATRSVLGKTSLRQLLSPTRERVMKDIQARVNSQTEDNEFGIEIIDVRIVRADLTDDLRDSTVRRMVSELKERATETRSKGEERALEIRSTANKEREIILAEAQRDSEIIRGEGDKDAIKKYATAFNQDKEFYSFYRSTEAYRNALANSETTLVISPDSDFFDYFDNID